MEIFSFFGKRKKNLSDEEEKEMVQSISRVAISQSNLAFQGCHFGFPIFAARWR